MRPGCALVLLALMIGCGEPWVTLGQRVRPDGASADASSADASSADASSADSDAAAELAPPTSLTDADAGSHTEDGEHPCVDDTQCTSGGHPFCDTARAVCVRCLSDLDCDAKDRCSAGDCVSRD